MGVNWSSSLGGLVPCYILIVAFHFFEKPDAFTPELFKLDS